MNKRICIEGKKVHQVGYRPFLLAKAMRLKIPNFDAENVEENGKQKVLVSISGEEKQISEFVDFIKENFPKFVKGCKVSVEKSSPEAVMHIDDYQKLLNAEQQNNIIQGGLQIGEKIDNFRKETTHDFDRTDANFDRLTTEMHRFREETQANFKHMDEPQWELALGFGSEEELTQESR